MMENGFWSLNEVLDFAIAREVEAQAFYTDMAARVDRPEMRKVFEDFAREEQGHETKLEAVKRGEYLFESRAGPAPGLGLAEYLVAGELTPEMSYADALILAMKKEKASYKLYLDRRRWQRMRRRSACSWRWRAKRPNTSCVSKSSTMITC